MARDLLSLLGVVMLAAPGRVVEAAESLAFENPDAAVRREWTLPMARSEGLAYLLLSRRATGSSVVGTVFGLLAATAAVAPRRYLRFGLGLAYEDPEDIRVRSWVVPGARVVGLLSVYSVLSAVRRGGGENPSADAVDGETVAVEA